MMTSQTPLASVYSHTFSMYSEPRHGLWGRKSLGSLRRGAASTWTPDMNTQESVSKSLKKSDEYWDKKSLSDQIDAMGPYLVARNVDKFRDNLASLFVGLSRDDVKFKAWDFGTISVTKDGTLQTAYSV